MTRLTKNALYIYIYIYIYICIYIQGVGSMGKVKMNKKVLYHFAIFVIVNELLLEIAV